MAQNRCLGIRVSEEVLQKLDHISKATQLSKSLIVSNLVEKTVVNEETGQYFINCSSKDHKENFVKIRRKA